MGGILVILVVALVYFVPIIVAVARGRRSTVHGPDLCPQSPPRLDVDWLGLGQRLDLHRKPAGVVRVSARHLDGTGALGEQTPEASQ